VVRANVVGTDLVGADVVRSDLEQRLLVQLRVAMRTREQR